MRILIAEDDLTCRLLLSELLSGHGRCDAVVDGVEAVEAVRQALESDKPYDLICLDIGMPNLDGHGALKKIRALEEKVERFVGARGARIVMVTSATTPQDVVAAFREQCDGYLPKPVTAQKLSELLKNLEISRSAEAV
jgi:two-component system chemotaxis response regulator CheY